MARKTKKQRQVAELGAAASANKRKTTVPLQRERITALVEREIQRFVKQREAKIIDDLLTGGLLWCSNSSEHTIEDCARALIALLPIASVQDFEHVAASTIWNRELLKGASTDAAYKTARRILAPLGVRYAACGCLEWYSGSDCCDAATESRAA